MRHYDRMSFRHLNDSERYRDYEYLADDNFIGPNERVPHGATRPDEPPWSTLGGWETQASALERTFDEDRGQGREYGRDFGLGYGREHDPARTFERTGGDDYDRGYGRPSSMADRLEYPHEGYDRVDERTQQPRAPRMRARGGVVGVLRDLRDEARHPGDFVRRVVTGIFKGKGPRNWVRSDARIREEVCELLAEHPQIDATNIDVSVDDGEVTLAGTVEDRRAKRMAEEALDDVLGVKDVHNRLGVERGVAREGEGARQLSGSKGVTSSTAATRR